MLNALGLSSAQQSVLAAIPIVCFGVGAFASPALEKRLRPGLVPVALLAALAAGQALRGLLPAPGLFPGTVLACLAIALLNVQLPGLIHRLLAGHGAAMTAAYTMAMTLGGTAGAGLTVPLMAAARLSAPGALGLWTLPALVALAAWVPWALGSRSSARAVQPSRLRRFLASPGAWAVTVYFGLQSLLYYAVVSWLPTIYRDRGLSPAAGGYLLAAMTLAGIVGNFLGPPAVARLGSFAAASTATMALLLAGLLGVLAAPLGTALLWVALAGAGLGGSISLALLLIVERTAEAEGGSGMSTMAQGAGYLISASGPVSIGLLRSGTGGWNIPLLVLVGVTLAEVLLGLRVGAARVRPAPSPPRPGRTRSRRGG